MEAVQKPKFLRKLPIGRPPKLASLEKIANMIMQRNKTSDPTTPTSSQAAEESQELTPMTTQGSSTSVPTTLLRPPPIVRSLSTTGSVTTIASSTFRTCRSVGTQQNLEESVVEVEEEGQGLLTLDDVDGNRTEYYVLKALSTNRLSPSPSRGQYAETVDEEGKGKVEEPPTAKVSIPIFILTITIVQITMFYMYADDFLFFQFAFDPHRRYEAWRFFTVVFVHSSESHLWINMVAQLTFGILIECFHGFFRTAAIFILSVIGGSGIVTVLAPKVYCTGGSGGVYGLLISNLASILLNWYSRSETKQFCFQVVKLVIIGLYIVTDIGTNLFILLVLKVATYENHAGNMGSVFTGFLFAILILRDFTEVRWELKMKRVCKVIVALLFLLICGLNIFFPSHFLETVWDRNYRETYVLYVVQTVINSPDGSIWKQLCENDFHCENAVTQYHHNKTVPGNII